MPAVCCDAANKDIYAPMRVLRDDFLAFCEQRGVLVPWAALSENWRSASFNQLLQFVMPEANDLAPINTWRMYRGQRTRARFLHGIQLAGDYYADPEGELISKHAHANNLSCSGSLQYPARVNSSLHATWYLLLRCMSPASLCVSAVVAFVLCYTCTHQRSALLFRTTCMPLECSVVFKAPSHSFPCSCSARSSTGAGHEGLA